MIRRRGKTTNKGWFGRRARNTNRQASRQRSLRLEPLEQRTLLSAVTVTSGDDAGLGTLRAAIDMANGDSSIDAIVIDGVAAIEISSPLEYTGGQSLSIDGGGVVLSPDDDHKGEDAIDLLISSGDADLSLSNLTVQEGNNGIRVPISGDATGTVSVSLDNVTIQDNYRYGMHVDDQMFGSDASVSLTVSNSTVTRNGNGANLDVGDDAEDSDYDGIRVDEGGAGSITANITNSHFDENGADGLELDERGAGGITAVLVNSTFNDNGYQNPADQEDGIDFDEADAGSLHVTIVDSTFNENGDEGVDLDEEQDGNVWVSLLRVEANDNEDEGIKINEKFDDDGVGSAGNLFVSLINVEANGSNDQEGISITEEGAGNLTAILQNVDANDNEKEGIKISERRLEVEDEEGEDVPVPGTSEGNLFVSLINVEANGSNDQEGISITEEGAGNLTAILRNVDANDNKKEGIKISERLLEVKDEEGEDVPVPGTSEGDLFVWLANVEASGSKKQEGIAITEEGAGHFTAILQNVTANKNRKEGIDLSEEGTGNMRVMLRNVTANENGTKAGKEDDGIQIEEAGNGNLSVLALHVTAKDNGKDGLKVEQGDAGTGTLRLQGVTLENNGDDDLDTDGVTVTGTF